MGVDSSGSLNFEIIQEFAKYADEVYREQRIDILFFAEVAGKMQKVELPNISVKKAQRTDSVLSEVSQETKKALEDLYFEAMKGSKKIACLVNANNKGYCRVKLNKDHIKYFKEIQYQLDTMNRCYLQRILYD